jgi:non-ribosomal peptide synthetase-like protein
MRVARDGVMTVADAPARPFDVPEAAGLSEAELASELAKVLAEVVGVDEVAGNSHFFDDLGADSMVMTRFCARVRKRPDLPSPSVKDIYGNPTISALAAALAALAVAAPASAPSSGSGSGSASALLASGTATDQASADPATRSAPADAEAGEPAPIGKPRFVLCGALQLLMLLGMTYVAAVVLAQGYEWVFVRAGWIGGAVRAALPHLPPSVGASVESVLFGDALLGGYLRSAIFTLTSFVFLCTLPIVAKWVLVGRWKRQRIRVWSLAYLRFWVVKTLIRANPLVLFIGSPLYVMYLRALGAKIAPGVAIFSKVVPVCTDLLTIGEDTVIRKDAVIQCYRARAGVIETGPVSLGAEVLVSEATVLDIDTSMGHWAQLGHASSLHPGQSVPHGETWHGSPAVPADVNYRDISSARCGGVRRFFYSAKQLLMVVLVYLPLLFSGLELLAPKFPQFISLIEAGPQTLTQARFYTQALTGSYVLFFGSVLIGLIAMVIVPRLLSMIVVADRVYPLYGFRYTVFRTITRLSNLTFFTRMTGDTSYIVHYLKSLGIGLSHAEQTGSNFGMDVRQDTPYLSSVGRGTMVADGLSIINAEFSSTSFRVSHTSIGKRNFLGNRITYPLRGRTGDNVLLATKVMVPIDGKIRENVGLLGSPSFEIPRTVERDTRLDIREQRDFRRRLDDKNTHNVVSMGLYLLVRWLHFFVFAMIALAGAGLYTRWGVWAIALFDASMLVFNLLFWILVDWSVRWLQALRPNGCSIYDRAFWRHERFWKVCDDRYLMFLNGTPFKNVVWRLLGVHIGRRVFDDGSFFSERTMTTIGDECTLNFGVAVQCHSQEDGAFKSDCTVIGPRCTLGVNSFIHYGVSMGEGVELAAESFLMKGEEIPAGARWGGNPAREMA